VYSISVKPRTLAWPEQYLKKGDDLLVPPCIELQICLQKIRAESLSYAYTNLGCHAIIDMIAQEQDRPVIVSKVKYLGSCLLPSPIELEATIVLYHNRMHIPEFDVTIPIDKVSEIELAKGKDLPSQTIMMFGVVGLIVEKENPYMTIKIVNSSDSLLFKFDNMIIADKLVKEIKAAQDLQ
jgi:hypothetical protein